MKFAKIINIINRKRLSDMGKIPTAKTVSFCRIGAVLVLKSDLLVSLIQDIVSWSFDLSEMLAFEKMRAWHSLSS